MIVWMGKKISEALSNKKGFLVFFRNKKGMKIRSTSKDINDSAFIENLYKQMKKQTQSAINEHNHMVEMAQMYLDDGVTESECAELLVIDGLSREAAANYVQAAQDNNKSLDGQYEYSFSFEDVYGKVWSSYDINHYVYASSDEDAWEQAENKIFSDPSIEPERVVSIDKVS